jgi:hypothetical protein
MLSAVKPGHARIVRRGPGAGRTFRSCPHGTPQSFTVPEVRLLIVRVPGFGCGVWLTGAGGRTVVPGVPGYAPAPTAPGCASSRIAGVVRAGHTGAGRAQSRCQQMRNACFYGQSGLIFRIRCRAWRTRRAGMCQIR